MKIYDWRMSLVVSRKLSHLNRSPLPVSAWQVLGCKVAVKGPHQRLAKSRIEEMWGNGTGEGEVQRREYRIPHVEMTEVKMTGPNIRTNTYRKAMVELRRKSEIKCLRSILARRDLRSISGNGSRGRNNDRVGDLEN